MARPKKPDNELRDNRYSVLFNNEYSNWIESTARLRGIPPNLLVYLLAKNKIDEFKTSGILNQEKRI